ncbi:MAG: CapA family protein [Bacilli bacterium]|nr:CapA family protein [Bacilli bacterium]
MKKNRQLIVVLLTILIIVLVFLIFLYFFKQRNINSKDYPKIKEKNIIEEILEENHEERINKSFLNWLEKEYGNQKLSLLKEKLKSDNRENIWHDIYHSSLNVLLDNYNNIYSNASNIQQVNTSTNQAQLSFIGDVSLADNWYIIPKYQERGKNIYGILSEETVDILKNSTLTIANNEFTISNRGEKMPGKYYTFRASPNNLSIYQEMGVDLVTLANNHVYDFGEKAFQDTLEALKDFQIPYVGAGKNIDEAIQPYYFIVNGYKIAFLNATRAEKLILTPEATNDTGGVFRCYDPSLLIQQIKKVRQNSDIVITLLHWGKEDSSSLEDVQVETAKQYIEAGSDLIVGTHAHTLQGIDFYQGKAIIYNLGDFIFNHETKDTAIFQFIINNEKQFQYKIIPCQQKEKYTSIKEGNEKVRILDKLRTLSPNVFFEETGTFYEKSTD